MSTAIGSPRLASARPGSPRLASPPLSSPRLPSAPLGSTSAGNFCVCLDKRNLHRWLSNAIVSVVGWAAKTPHENRGGAVNSEPSTAPRTACKISHQHPSKLYVFGGRGRRKHLSACNFDKNTSFQCPGSHMAVGLCLPRLVRTPVILALEWRCI